MLQRHAIMIEENDLNVSATTVPIEFLKDSRTHVAYVSFYIPPGIHEKDMNVCIASRAQLVATNMKVIFNLSSRIERKRLKSRSRGRTSKGRMNSCGTPSLSFHEQNPE